MSKNDITGDEIKSKRNTKEYEDNYEKIFGHKQYCNLLHPATLGTKEDCCDCKQMNLPLNEYPDNSKDEAIETTPAGH